jgi:predicted acetyltransferase
VGGYGGDGEVAREGAWPFAPEPWLDGRTYHPGPVVTSSGPAVPVTIRPLTVDDREVAARLTFRAFTATPGQPFDADRPRVPDDRRVMAELDGRAVGHLGAWEFGHHLGGRRVATAGISAVVVAPEVRGRGVGGRLVRAGLEAARDRGEALASLFPLTRHVYRRHGFELAGAHPNVAIDTAALAALPEAPEVELTTGDSADLDRMLALERDLARTEPGMLDRPREFARATLRFGDHDHVVLAHRGGALTGYVVYGHGPASEDGAFYRLEVRELIGRDAPTLRALWRVLGSSSSAARTVEATVAPEDALELWLPERAWRARSVTWRWMTRLVDPVGAIAARGWPTAPRGACQLRLTDPVWPDLDGPWTLEFDGHGAAQLTRGGDGHVAVDIGALASWFTGWTSATRLTRYGRVTGADPADLHLLDAATTGPTPWVRSFF